MNYSQRGYEALRFRVIQILDPKNLRGWVYNQRLSANGEFRSLDTP
ncbi:hypothetical protein PMAG_a3434 [Pseudoalteromonas mariniglutinosa NCIMB 1770]|nr:hypothetical protein [Pseudoalteromonas mariniglutinosa NCIMB 1770]